MKYHLQKVKVLSLYILREESLSAGSLSLLLLSFCLSQISIDRDEAEKNLDIAEEVIKTLINHIKKTNLINQINLL